MALSKSLGLDKEAQEDLIWQYSGEETTSKRELPEEQAWQMLKTMQNQANTWGKSERKMRAKCIRIALEIGFAKDERQEQVNWPKLNGWFKKYSYLRKAFNAYRNTGELVGLVNQFEMMRDNIERAKVNKELDSVLVTLGISKASKG
ncbi:hypothetical protein [Algivirga pacifica]